MPGQLLRASGVRATMRASTEGEPVTMRARPFASLALLLLVPLVLVPSPARAGIGDACPEPSDAVFEFTFETPRGGSAAACRAACKVWTKACRKIASAARSCRQVLEDARIRIDTEIDCDGLTGSEGKECTKRAKEDRKFVQRDLKDDVKFAREDCGFEAEFCEEDCVAEF